jgi:hypothetical protein
MLYVPFAMYVYVLYMSTLYIQMCIQSAYFMCYVCLCPIYVFALHISSVSLFLSLSRSLSLRFLSLFLSLSPLSVLLFLSFSLSVREKEEEEEEEEAISKYTTRGDNQRRMFVGGGKVQNSNARELAGVGVE